MVLIIKLEVKLDKSMPKNTIKLTTTKEGELDMKEGKFENSVCSVYKYPNKEKKTSINYGKFKISVKKEGYKLPSFQKAPPKKD